MIRLIAVTFALVLATSVQAMPVAPLHQPDGMTTQVRMACGAGRVRINGVCVARTTRRHVRRSVRRCAVWGAGHVCHRWLYWDDTWTEPGSPLVACRSSEARTVPAAETATGRCSVV